MRRYSLLREIIIGHSARDHSMGTKWSEKLHSELQNDLATSLK